MLLPDRQTKIITLALYVMSTKLKKLFLGPVPSNWIQEDRFDTVLGNRFELSCARNKHFYESSPLWRQTTNSVTPKNNVVMHHLQIHNRRWWLDATLHRSNIRLFTYRSEAAHTTQLLQPLDVGGFGPFKTKYRSMTISACRDKPYYTLKKDMFPQMYQAGQTLYDRGSRSCPTTCFLNVCLFITSNCRLFSMWNITPFNYTH